MTSPGLIRCGLRGLANRVARTLAAGLLLMLVATLPIGWHGQARAATPAARWSARPTLGPALIAQAGNDKQDGGVTPGAIAQYVAVYRDMQRDRGLSVKQAAANQGMSLAQFRQLEGRVERDSAARNQAREELQAAAKSSAASPIPSPEHK